MVDEKRFGLARREKKLNVEKEADLDLVGCVCVEARQAMKKASTGPRYLVEAQKG